jgi:hypothetical protein
MVSSLLEPASVGQEQTMPISEALSVRRTGDIYEMRRTSSMPGGQQLLLIAHIRPDGTVIDATMSGGAPLIGASEAQRLSMLAARTLPERLVMGREFRPGDNLYADIEMQDLVAILMGALASPPGFQVQASGTLPFTGMSGDGANRVLNFSGQIEATGSGGTNGQNVVVRFPGQATITMDAASGLQRSETTEGTMSVKLNGVTQMEMHMRQTLTCTITPAT